jgi:GxxExxY protein
MEVHNQLGSGFLEIVYKDALEFEFGNLGIPHAREKEYAVQYKDTLLPHSDTTIFLFLPSNVTFLLP